MSMEILKEKQAILSKLKDQYLFIIEMDDSGLLICADSEQFIISILSKEQSIYYVAGDYNGESSILATYIAESAKEAFDKLCEAFEIEDYIYEGASQCLTTQKK